MVFYLVYLVIKSLFRIWALFFFEKFIHGGVLSGYKKFIDDGVLFSYAEFIHSGVVFSFKKFIHGGCCYKKVHLWLVLFGYENFTHSVKLTTQ